jgi:hypothetical protein
MLMTTITLTAILNNVQAVIGYQKAVRDGIIHLDDDILT